MIKNIYLVFISGFILRIFISIMINTYPEYFYSVASNDAIGFSIKASVLLENLSMESIIATLKWNLYPLLLTFVYYLTFPNIYIGSLFTIIIWSISFFVIFDTLKILKLSNSSKTFALIFYSFFPSLVIFSSVTLRDVFILLFLNLIFNLILRFYFKKYFIFLLLIILSALFIYLMHENFLILFFLTLPLFYTIVFFIINIYNNRVKPIYFFFVLFSLVIFFNIDFLINLSSIYERFNDFQLGALAHKGKASYIDTIFYIRNIYDLIYYLIFSFYKYILSPFIFDLNKIRIIDFVVILENLMRFMIVFLILFNLRYLKNKDKFFTTLFIIIFFTIELCWSVGTFNWGTAIRHHVCSIGVLTILLAYLYDIIRKKNEEYS